MDRDRILNRLLTEIEKSRELIAAMRAEVAKREEEVKAIDDVVQLQAAAYKKALTEITELRAKISEEEAALREREAQVAMLRDERDRYRRKYKTAVKVAGAAAIAAGVATFLLVR